MSEEQNDLTAEGESAGRSDQGSTGNPDHPGLWEQREDLVSVNFQFLCGSILSEGVGVS